MLKKTIIGASVVALAGMACLGRDTWSYCYTSFRTVRQAVKSEVPIEFEVQRARDLVAQVDGEIRKCLHVIAEEEVNLDHLRKEIDTQVTQHARQKEQILVQRQDLRSNKTAYTYGGRIYTVSEVEQDLADRFERYQSVDETLKSRRQVLNARESSLGAARRKLDSMLDSKEQLLLQVENLEARYRTLQAAQVASNISLDDSHIARTRQLIAELSKQVEVKQKLVDGVGNTTGLIPVDLPTEVKPGITAQIDSYFGGSVEEKPVVAEGEQKTDVSPASVTASR